MSEEQPLQVARCTRIIGMDPEKAARAAAISRPGVKRARMNKINMSSTSNRSRNSLLDSVNEYPLQMLRKEWVWGKKTQPFTWILRLLKSDHTELTITRHYPDSVTPTMMELERTGLSP